MFKYYAVKRGRKTGIFNTWSECYDSVMGYEKPIYRVLILPMRNGNSKMLRSFTNL